MITAFLVFLAGYCCSMFYTSILYHRGLAHQALELSPFLLKLIEKTGMIITGIDPKGWVCMHRLHHKYSDTNLDPHSPVHNGVWYTFVKQHKSFERILIKLIKQDPETTALVKDIPFSVHWLNRKGYWWAPFAMHFIIGILLSLSFSWMIGVAYFLGICGHPVQGFMVNAFAHTYGYRTFDDEPDRSTNNFLVAWLVFGEGYQNNHHRYPNSAKFSMQSYEIDPGFVFVKILQWSGLAKINEAKMVPKTVK